MASQQFQQQQTSKQMGGPGNIYPQINQQNMHQPDMQNPGKQNESMRMIPMQPQQQHMVGMARDANQDMMSGSRMATSNYPYGGYVVGSPNGPNPRGYLSMQSLPGGGAVKPQHGMSMSAMAGPPAWTVPRAAAHCQSDYGCCVGPNQPKAQAQSQGNQRQPVIHNQPATSTSWYDFSFPGSLHQNQLG